jgi:hypothetical protein
MTEVDLKALAKLREPFAENQIGKLPKPKSKDAPKGHCAACGGYHGLPAVHLDFVGHAALTDRFLDVDLEWTWKPMAVNENGLPLYDQFGGLWIWLTIAGVTRPGYGSADGKTGGNAIKEAIGDALRNGGMRYGAALDLWHKGDLHDVDQAQNEPQPTELDEALSELGDMCAGLGLNPSEVSGKFFGLYKVVPRKSDAATVREFIKTLDAVGVPEQTELAT